MSDEHATPEPTELVYTPDPSWLPIFVAAGITIILVATFIWWVYGIFGVALLLPALRSWWTSADDDASRLPRAQKRTTAVLPAVPPKPVSRV